VTQLLFCSHRNAPPNTKLTLGKCDKKPRHAAVLYGLNAEGQTGGATVQTDGCNGRQRQWNKERSDDKFGPGLIGRVDCGVASPVGRGQVQIILYHAANLIQMSFVAGRRRPVLFLHRYLRAVSAFVGAKPLSASTLLCRQIYP